MKIKKELIKRIIFDLDNTLIDWKEEYWNSLNKTFEELNLEYSNNDINKIKDAIDIYEDGRNLTYNKQKMQNTIEDELGYKLPVEFIDIWMKHLGMCIPEKLDESIPETLQYLKEKYDLVILSNWLKESQIERLKNAGLYEYFTDLYMTEDIPMKPNKESFEIAKGKYKEDECVMIGDNFKVDIEGAIKAGMQTIYLNKKEMVNDSNRICTIHKISELKKIL